MDCLSCSLDPKWDFTCVLIGYSVEPFQLAWDGLVLEMARFEIVVLQRLDRVNRWPVRGGGEYQSPSSNCFFSILLLS